MDEVKLVRRLRKVEGTACGKALKWKFIWQIKEVALRLDHKK